jgi:CCR4-NOT transcription complex subunit 4
MIQQNQPQPAFTQPTPGFQPFEVDLSEARLREFIQSSRERANTNNLHISHEGQ